MADRMCNLCRNYYTDKTGHNYDICVSRCFEQLERDKIAAHKAIDHLNDAHAHLHEAIHIQKQDWWKKEN